MPGDLDYSLFLGSGVRAFTTSREVDFHKGVLTAPGFVLTPGQQAYLWALEVDSPQGLLLPKQVHGDVIWKVTARDFPSAGVFEADAIVTDAVGLPIAVRTADCCP
ncbi:MAG: laccase domain-containing protein, partial [Candidatus Omnitrophica bacterium]|nr:laccase domain-containing protein [Candidatus Omnitrophota bacterium]